MIKSKLVAHRGYAKQYPENTMIAIEAALEAGVQYVEFDIQFTSDGVPVLLHDPGLKRTTGVNKRIFNVDAASLREIRVKEAKTHPKKFGEVGIPTLAEVIELFQRWPKARAFVEIKTESIETFGIEKVIKTLVKVCNPIIDRCILISYDALSLRCGRAMGFKHIGLVLKKYDDEHQSLATELNPEYLFCNYTKLPRPEIPLWPGPWAWTIYEVDKVKMAIDLLDRGIDLLETMAVGELIKSKQLQSYNALADEAV